MAVQNKKGQNARSTREEHEAQLKTKREKKELWKRIAIGVFAVIIALSMMLPSLAQIFSAHQNAKQQKLPTTVAEVNERFDPSVKEYEQKAQANPNDVNAQLSLSQIYIMWSQAIESYAANDQGAEEASREHYQKALEILDNAVTKFPDSEATIQISRSQVFRSLGDVRSAVSAIGRALELKPEDPYALLEQSAVFARLGQVDQQKATLEKIKTLKDVPQDILSYVDAMIQTIDSSSQKSGS